MKFIIHLIISLLSLSSFSQEMSTENKSFHKYKISTNLLRPTKDIKHFPTNEGRFGVDYISSGRVFSFEPEFQVSNQFSIAVPIYFGVNRMDTSNYNHLTLHSWWNYIDSVTTPALASIQTNYHRSLDMIGQVGVQGKWFPWGHEIHEKSKFYPFLSAGLHLALYDIYAMDFGQTWTQEKIDDTQWGYYGQNSPLIALHPHKTMVFRGEFLIGSELIFRNNIGLILSMGYSTPRIYFNEATDRLYSRKENEEFELVGESKFPGENTLSADKRKIFILRLQLTYAFGSKKSLTKEPRIKENTKEFKNTLSGLITDPFHLSIGASYERLFFSRWGAEASFGFPFNASIGTKLYFPKVTAGKLSYYIGLSESVYSSELFHYIPGGLTYLHKNGFRFSFDLGPRMNKNLGSRIGAVLKIGRSF